MPKDATKNVDRYKVRGGQLNQFDYTENQKAVAGKKSGNKAKGSAKLIPGTPPEEAGQGLQPTVTASTKKATKKAASSSKKAAKTPAARKAAKK